MDLLPTVQLAQSKLRQELTLRAPGIATAVQAWCEGLASGKPAEHRFTYDLMFPIFQVPFWVEEAIGEQTAEFRADVAYSTLNGYYFIRLLDDVVDARKDKDSGSVDTASLLPAAGFFHMEFQRTYHRHFEPQAPFWEDFRTIWAASSEAMFLDAGATAVTAEFFSNVSCKKLSAVKIPVAAVCHKAGRVDSLIDWWQFCDRYAEFQQRLDDLLDWYEDLSLGNNTHFLFAAEQSKAPGETVAAWVAREGFKMGSEEMTRRLEDLRSLAEGLQSPPVRAHLKKVASAMRDRLRVTTEGLDALQLLAAQFNRGEPGRKNP